MRAYWRHNKTKRGIQILSRLVTIPPAAATALFVGTHTRDGLQDFAAVAAAVAVALFISEGNGACVVHG